MKLCRFKSGETGARVGLIVAEELIDLTDAGVETMQTLLEDSALADRLAGFARGKLPRISFAEVELLAPVERQEIWAAGVTYLRSKSARMEESDFSASAYDRVYEAARPELFLKSLPEKVVGPGEAVGIRNDSRWNVPEPELALVLNSRGSLVGFTIGNDMSSRDIEGENLLYLPQAKVYHRSCAVGPAIAVGVPESEAREWTISLAIWRGNEAAFLGETRASQIKRSFDDLAEYLFRAQVFPHGAVLLTGTGIVPQDEFSLAAGDRVRIQVSGIGILENPVIVV